MHGTLLGSGCKSGLRSGCDVFSPADCDHSRRADGDIWCFCGCFSVLNQVSAASVVQQNAATLFYCEAPELFCGHSVYFWVNCSFKLEIDSTFSMSKPWCHSDVTEWWHHPRKDEFTIILARFFPRKKWSLNWGTKDVCHWATEAGRCSPVTICRGLTVETVHCRSKRSCWWRRWRRWRGRIKTLRWNRSEQTDGDAPVLC